MDTIQIKNEAIQETITLFKGKYNVIPDANKLSEFLNKEDDAIEILLGHISDKIRQGERTELIDELKTYREANEKEKIKINLNTGGYTTNSKPVNLIYPFCLVSFYYLFHLNQIAIINNSEFQQTKDETHIPKPEPETTEQKIKRILDLNRGAFADENHIDIITDAFIKCYHGERLPKENKKVVIKELKQFIEPFGQLFKDKTFKRGEISRTLLFFIEKNTAGSPEYSESYLNKLLSECKKG